MLFVWSLFYNADAVLTIPHVNLERTMKKHLSLKDKREMNHDGNIEDGQVVGVCV